MTGEDRSAAPSLIRLFIDRPVLTLMASLAIVVIGVLALSRLPLRLAPEGMSSDSINLYVPVPRDMPPREVEERVVKPLEELIQTIPGVKEIESRASSDSAFCTITLENGMNPILAGSEIRDRVQRARLQWPDEVDRYMTWREDASSAPLAFFQIQTPARGDAWDTLLDQNVRVKLEAVDGVGRVDIWGLVDESLRIWFDRDKLIEHRLDYGRLLQALASDNFTRPVGELDDGRARYLVRVDSKFRSREEIERYPIRPGLTIGDIARVEMVPSVRDSLARYDGKFTYTAVLRLASGTNPVEASNNVRVAMDELEADPDLAGIGFRFLFDQGAMIQDSLQTLLSTSLQGGLLALVALFLFLRNIRLTIAIATAIPMTLMIAAGYLFFAGHSLNILTMAGMTLAVGMVVDNSVVVLENIRRHRAEGQDLRTACLEGSREMVLAITMATLTTVVVILPLVFMGSSSNVRASLVALGMPLSIALLGSLGVGLLLLPAATRVFGTGKVPPPVDEGHVDLRTPIGWIQAVNQWILRFTLGGMGRRIAVSALLVVAFATVWVPGSLLDFSMGGGGSPFRGGDARISLEMPRGYSLSEVAALVEEYESFLDQRRDEFGIDHVAVRFDRTSARFDVIYEEDVPRDEHDERRRGILDTWPRKAGVRIALRDTGGGGGMGQSSSEEDDQRNFVIRLWGPDSEFLASKALEIRDRLVALPEVLTAEVGDAEGSEQVVVEVDRERASELGLQPASIERTMSSGLRGQELTRFEEDGKREIRLIAQFDAERNPTLYDLKETKVYSRTGTFQRIDDVAEIRFERALSQIRRTDGKTNVTIVGERAPEVGSRELTATLGNVLATTQLPRGYSWSEDSATRDVQLQLAEIWDAFLLALVLVFLLMAILFESVILPGAALATVPFAVLGAMWSLLAFHDGIDVMAGIGILLLAGVVVNNGIVLLDGIERLRRKGVERRTAVLQGVRERMRPIVMTATTTIVGLLPMALFGESTGEGVSYVGMSIAVSGGLTICTVFTTIVVPVVYLFLDDFQNWFLGAMRRAFDDLAVIAKRTGETIEPS